METKHCWARLGCLWESYLEGLLLAVLLHQMNLHRQDSLVEAVAVFLVRGLSRALLVAQQLSLPSPWLLVLRLVCDVSPLAS